MPTQDEQLKRAGLKVTLPRLKVMQVLEEADPHHLSAEEIYKHLLLDDEMIGHATVYRVLVQLESANIVQRHNFEEGHAVYELLGEQHHDHMVDVESGEVVEFVNERIEEIQREIVTQHGFELVDHELVLYVRKLKEPG